MRRMLGLARVVAAANLGRDVPYRVSWILNYRCNCRCASCRIWERAYDGVIDPEHVRTFLRRNPRLSWINLSGGEIFLKRDLIEVVDAIYDEARRLFLLDFPTTGLQTRRIVESIRHILTRDPEKLLVTVSLDGPEEHHNRVRGVPDGFRKTLETFAELRPLRSRHFDVFLGMTLGSGGQVGVAETIDAVRTRIPDFRPEELHVNLLHLSDHYYGNTATERPEQSWASREMKGFLRMKPASLHPVAFLERRYQQLLARYERTGRTPVPCVALKDNCFIDPDWNVFPCSIWSERAGNLRDFDFDLGALVRSERARELRRSIVAERCPHCWTPCEAYASILGNLARGGLV